MAATTEMLVPSDSQLTLRLPEIESVDGHMKDQLVECFQQHVPPYFWLVRASEDYHPPDERGLGGLWLHTKRAYTAYRMLEPTYRAMSAIDSYQANCARTAVLLHDAFKYGIAPMAASESDPHDYADGRLDHVPEYTEPSHDVDTASVIRTETELPEEVARCIEAHGGSPDWYGHEGPRPSDDLEMLVHTADVIASNANHRLPVWEPTAELLMMTDKNLPQVDGDEWVLRE